MSRMNAGLLSSHRGDWTTPRAFFDLVDEEFGFTLDAAASDRNAMKAAEIRLVRGRLVFGTGEARANAPFPSALVVFRPGDHTPTISAMDRGTLTRRAA